MLINVNQAMAIKNKNKMTSFMLKITNENLTKE